MELGLNNKIALVSGAGQGVGFGIAGSLLGEGAQVAIVEQDEERLEQAANKLSMKFEGSNIMPIHADFTDEFKIKESIKKIIVQWGHLDIVAANIGTGRSQIGWDVDDDEWKRMFELNLFASIKLSRAVIPQMVKQKKGVINFTASIAGLEAIPAPICYSAAKAALITTSKNLARELAPYGIRVNTVAPGNVYFEQGTWDIKMKKDREAIESYIRENVPMNRFASPQEIGDLVAFLASDRASFITGACLMIDGGQTHVFH
ncbi:SDR family oxidoreductase [candidate division KSB1 bacterium]|nr:SDR family oxidoreductase [candidate division KSB1 bacterium]